MQRCANIDQGTDALRMSRRASHRRALKQLAQYRAILFDVASGVFSYVVVEGGDRLGRSTEALADRARQRKTEITRCKFSDGARSG
jgi:hypothetical protein